MSQCVPGEWSRSSVARVVLQRGPAHAQRRGKCGRMEVRVRRPTVVIHQEGFTGEIQ